MSNFTFSRNAAKTGLILAFFSFFLSGKLLKAQVRLTVSPEMVTNLSARGDEWLLFDYQSLESSYPCVIPQTDFQWVYFDATWNGKRFFYPIDVVVDLGYSQLITQICLRDASNPGGQVTVYTGGEDPTSWNNLYQHNQNSQECQFPNVQTRYLKFSFNSTDARIREIELYGIQANTVTCPPPLTTCSPLDECSCPRIPMDKLIGINSNMDVPAQKLKPFGFVRNYQTEYFNNGYDDTSYEGYPNAGYGFAPTFRPEFDVDYFYDHLKDVGIEDVVSTNHHAPGYLVTFGYLNNNVDYNAVFPFAQGIIDDPTFHKVIERKPFSEALYPITLDARYENPAMFLEYSEWFYQFGARYGNPGNNQNLKVIPGNTPKTGLGTVQYIENWNEPDKYWQYSLVEHLDFLGPEMEQQLGYFNPFEYAAMSSANYDGNGQTNGVQNILLDRFPDNVPSNSGPVGLLAANSNMKFVMAGLSEINTDYVRAIKFWFDQYRPDIEFPFDVINFHDYANNATNGNTLGEYAISPEEYGLKEKMQEAVAYRDRYLPGVEVWLSEFGYDTNPYSIQSPNCNVFCSDCSSLACRDKFYEIQAQWNIRSYLELAAAGVDRAMAFTLRDSGPPENGWLYGTTGVCEWAGESGYDFNPKTSWYYISTMSKALKGLKYDPGFIHNDPGVRIYKFTEDCGTGGRTVYAVWSPTATRGDNSPVYANYPLPFLGNSATLIEMEDGDVDGNKTILTPQCHGQVCVNVTERPKFIVAGTPEPGPDMTDCDCNYLPFQISGQGTSGNLNDEQNNLGELYCGEGNTMYTAWNTLAGQEVVIDLNNLYDLNSLYFHCTGENNGNVEIYFGNPGNWQLFKTWNTRNPSPSKWRGFNFNENITTQYIRLRAMSNNINIEEMAVCGTSETSTGPSCNDGIQNGSETGIDCGGDCPPCSVATCSDGILNGNETGIDCGGNCPDCPNCFDGIQNGNETGTDCGGNCSPCNTGSCLIALTPDMFFDSFNQSASGTGFAGSLANEQDITGDPVNGNGGQVSDAWEFPWFDGVQAYVDLGQEYNISAIAVYDGYGSGIFRISPGLPGQNLTPVVNADMNLWPPDWRNFNNINTTTRYLTFTRVDGEAKVNEIAICGTPAGNGPNCNDGIQNGNETGIDCGGTCPACPNCFDEIQNGSETGVDCGGNCSPCVVISCSDGIQNGNETGIDCGGTCPACPNCFDGIQNGSETGVDCGGNCSPCVVVNCSDGIQNGNETGIDCGGTCPACPNCFDGIQNGSETGVDCGGNCSPCVVVNCSDGIQNGNETGIDCGGNCSPCQNGSCQIPLSPSMFYNIYNQSDASANFSGSLADEQNIMGDPVNGDGSEVFVPWQFAWYDGVQGYVDLGQEYSINGIYLYDGFGSGRFQIAPGLPSSESPAIIDVSLNLWPPGWRSFEAIQLNTRYLTFTRIDGEAKVNELAICGFPTGIRQAKERPEPFLSATCKMNVHPNPVEDILYLQGNTDNLKRLVISDMNGQILIEKQHFTVNFQQGIDVSMLKNGMYFIYSETTGKCGPTVERFVKMDQW